MQPRKISLLEAVTSTAIGYGVAVGTQIIIFPWFGLQVTLQDNLAIGAIFTIISIARGYVIRRLFNKLQKTQIRACNNCKCC